jgi:hypothetical protein
MEAGMNLEITALTRKTAILEIVRQCHADQVGAPVLLTVLMVAWAQTGLRDSDLSTGLNELLDDGSFSLNQDPHNPSVALTAAGKAWIEGVGVDPRERLEQERILRAARQRADNKPPEKLAPGQEPRWRIIDRRLQLD